jgi:hypothetical protein
MCWNESYSIVRTDNICLTYPVPKALKKCDALLSLLFNFPLEYAFRKVKENMKGLKLNGTHQFAAYAKLLGRNINTKKNTRFISRY